MNTWSRKSNQRGMSFAEVLVAFGILGILIIASYTLTSGSQLLSKSNMDRQFATQKAISMMEELRSLAQAAVGPSAIVLDQFDDGVNYKDELTINPVGSPADKLSGNFQLPNGNWLYSRRISVQRVAGQSTAGVRLVRVSVYKWENGDERPVAEVASIIRTLATNAPPTQVYDVYAIALKNVPGWWVYTANLVPFVQSAITELSSRNPGLEFRVHWITKLAYGRDDEYRPYVNKVSSSIADIPWVYFYPGSLPLNDATRNPPNLAEYYPTGGFESRINIDGTFLNDYSIADPNVAGNPAYNPFPFALADQFNHAKRYPEERALYLQRKGAVDPFDTTPDDGISAYPGEEPTYRLLLDDMVLHPTEYTNAILINLHGELFPFPPIRNYSDPAKAPETASLRWLRAVTHPEKLAYNTATTATSYPTVDSNDIKLRVYTYEAWRGAVTTAPMNTEKWFHVPITVVIKNVTMASNITVQRIAGGNTNQGTGKLYARSSALIAAPANSGMYATIANSGFDTVIKLYNSPFQANECSGDCSGSGNNGMGLNSNYYLYGMEYVPHPVENFALGDTGNKMAFNVDLADSYTTAGAKGGYIDTGVGPRNTARWVITIPTAALNTELGANTNTMLTVETRIGDTVSTGTLTPTRNQPSNLSKTYVWRGTDTWLYGDGTETNPPNLPLSERFQFIGDPRHSPYAESKKIYSAAATSSHYTNSRLAEGYNRYFDDFASSADGDQSARWPGFNILKSGDGVNNNDGWPTGGNDGQIEVDVDRSFQILRNALTASRAIYTTMTGYSYYYMGLGGEIGYDTDNQFTNSIPVSAMPFTGVSGPSYEQSIINGSGNYNSGCCPQGPGVKYVRQVGTTTDYWWSINWLGELWPDDQYTSGSNWSANGNLSTGTSASSFRRVLRGLIAPTTKNMLPQGTDFEGGLVAGNAHYTNAVRRTGPAGSTDFFWTGTSTSTFHHTSVTANADIVSEGAYIANTASGYNFPLLNPIPNNRPFALNLNGTNPEAFLNARYGPAFITNEDARYYQNANTSGPGSSLISTRNPSTNRPAFVVVNGLSPVGQSGVAFIARWSFLSLIHSYMEAGLYTDALPAPVGCTGCPFRVRQLPRVIISSPNAQSILVDPPSINIQWTATWKRWDDKKYTPAYSSTFSESGLAMEYQVLYSVDNGVTWRFVQDDTPWTRGTKLPTGDPRLITGATNYVWNTPDPPFVQGNYIIRVEGYRAGFPLHYSYHQYTAFIRRTS